MTYTFTTSGTTGKPKRFTVSDEFMNARVDARIAAHGDALKDIKSMFCDVGPTTTLGVTYRLWAKKLGVRFQENAIESTAATMAWCEKEKIDAIVCTITGLSNYARVGGHKFKKIICGGALLDPQRLATIQAGLGDDVINLYATSEMGAISTATSDQIKAFVGCVGTLCPGVQVEFDNKLLKIKTTTMIEGYDDPALTAMYFKDGWFVPGDKGRMEGNLLVLEPR